MTNILKEKLSFKFKYYRKLLVINKIIQTQDTTSIGIKIKILTFL